MYKRQALWVLHSLGVVHRDVKPDNVIIRGTEAVLIDFDASRIYKNENREDTQILGTTGFAAPEPVSYTHLDVYKRQTVKQIFYFKIIGDSVTDSLCCINYAAASNWQKEVNTFRPSNADPFFYQGKTRIGNHATKVYIGKSGSIQALMYTFQ